MKTCREICFHALDRAVYSNAITVHERRIVKHWTLENDLYMRSESAQAQHGFLDRESKAHEIIDKALIFLEN